MLPNVHVTLLFGTTSFRGPIVQTGSHEVASGKLLMRNKLS
jgi:hypothetical protein